MTFSEIKSCFKRSLGQLFPKITLDSALSYLPSDMLAAFLYGQFEIREVIQAKRKRIREYHNEHLKDWAEGNNVRLPVIPEYCEQPYHMFYMLMPSLEQRQNLIAHLNQRGIHSVFHYLPLHLSNVGVTFGGKAGDCPVTENISDRLLRLPFYNSLSEIDQQRVVDAIFEFRSKGNH